MAEPPGQMPAAAGRGHLRASHTDRDQGGWLGLPAAAMIRPGPVRVHRSRSVRSHQISRFPAVTIQRVIRFIADSYKAPPVWRGEAGTGGATGAPRRPGHLLAQVG